MMNIMKKMYIKPITETAGREIKGQALCTSPNGQLNNSNQGTDQLGGGEIIGG